MNKEFVLFDLREALEERERTINEIETDDKYGNVEFQIAMSPLYHHLNTAWNSKDASAERHSECSGEDFKQWRRFPKESDWGLARTSSGFDTFEFLKSFAAENKRQSYTKPDPPLPAES